MRKATVISYGKMFPQFKLRVVFVRGSLTKGPREMLIKIRRLSEEKEGIKEEKILEIALHFLSPSSHFSSLSLVCWGVYS
jgi:hypothetical protein